MSAGCLCAIAIVILAGVAHAQDKPPLSMWTYSAPTDRWCLTDTVSNIISVPVYIQGDPSIGIRFAKITLEYDESYWYPLEVINTLGNSSWLFLPNLDPASTPVCTGILNKELIVLFSTGATETWGCNGTGRIPFIVRMQRTGKSGHTPVKMSCSLANTQVIAVLLSDTSIKYYYGWGYPGTLIGNSCWDLRDVSCQQVEPYNCGDNQPYRLDCGKCPPVISP